MRKLNAENLEKATFAGGCFWCMEPPFDKIDGVKETITGYTGGHVQNPSYEDVCSGTTGHAEAIEIHFDPANVTYQELLEVFWRNIDPTTKDQQFADFGTQYRTAVFYHSEEQKRQALESRDEMEAMGKFNNRIVTEIVPANVFYPAEEYHQNYYQKNSMHYNRYKKGSGRADYLEKMWPQS